jgi:hypothetical protein
MANAFLLLLRPEADAPKGRFPQEIATPHESKNGYF